MTHIWKDAEPSQAVDRITEFRLNFTANRSKQQPTDNLWWSVLVQLNNTTISEFNAAMKSEFGMDFLIPNDFLNNNFVEEHEDPILTFYARTPVVEALNGMNSEAGVTSISLGAVVPANHINAEQPVGTEPDDFTVVPDGSVAIGVIDDGIAFGHNLFRKGLCDSRVEGMFIMAAPASDGSDLGKRLKKERIDQLLSANTHSGLLDEERFYRQAGSINRADNFFSTIQYRRSHGTHVMALAAGYDMADSQEQRPIIAAQLPTAVTNDPSGSNIVPSLRHAIRYILKQSRTLKIADESGNTPPLVVNFSYGNFAGPHDGTGLVAQVIDKELRSTEEQQVRVMLPAGNGNLARCHASVNFEPECTDDKVQLDLCVYPDDFTCSYVQMWMPYSSASVPPNFVNVRVTPPNGEPSKIVRARKDSKQVLCNKEGKTVAELSYRFEPAPTSRGVIVLMVHPTASRQECDDLAPSGRWLLSIEKAKIEPTQSVEVWIRRDETLPGYPPFGRQAYFDNADYVRFDKFGAPLSTDPPNSNSPVKRAGTLSGFATGSLPMVIGGLTQQNGLLSDYSAAGPITPTRGDEHADRLGPDASARSDDSPVLSGVLSAGSHSGSMVRMNGTSVSTPLVARQIADALAAGQAADRAWLWEEAAHSDPTYPQPKPRPSRTGGGRLLNPFPFEPKAAEV